MWNWFKNLHYFHAWGPWEYAVEPQEWSNTAGYKWLRHNRKRECTVCKLVQFRYDDVYTKY